VDSFYEGLTNQVVSYLSPGSHHVTLQLPGYQDYSGTTTVYDGQTTYQEITLTPPGAVTIQNFAFSPPSITVPRGTTVTWTNRDPAQHTVVSDVPRQFSSPVLETGQVFAYAFNDAGSYPYHCGIYPTMHGTVTVT